MSLMCDCQKCGGLNPDAMCENSLLEARMNVAKAEQRQPWYWLIAGVLLAAGLLLGRSHLTNHGLASASNPDLTTATH